MDHAPGTLYEQMVTNKRIKRTNDWTTHPASNTPMSLSTYKTSS